jgi:hypothetical protein
MVDTTITLDGAKMGAVIAAGPGWIVKLEMTRRQSHAWQVEHFMPHPWNRWTSGKFVLRDTAAPLPMFSFAPQSSGYPEGFILSYGMRFWGDLLLECIPANSEWVLTTTDVQPALSRAA